MTATPDPSRRPSGDHQGDGDHGRGTGSPHGATEQAEATSAPRDADGRLLPVPLLDGDRAQEADDLTTALAGDLGHWFDRRATLCEHTMLISFGEAADALMKVIGPRIAELRDQYEQLYGAFGRLAHERDRYRDSLPAETQDYWYWRHRAEKAETDARAARAELAEADTDTDTDTAQHLTSVQARLQAALNPPKETS